jgi:Holliday junction resolvase-like predicted endonuclease
MPAMWRAAVAPVPKLQVLNTALMTVTAGITLEEARADREFWGRLVESAVGAQLANAALRGECTLHYWRERNHEVDFVVKAGRWLTAIEVKSGRAPQAHPGTAAFVEAFKPNVPCWWAATASRWMISSASRSCIGWEPASEQNAYQPPFVTVNQHQVRTHQHAPSA